MSLILKKAKTTALTIAIDIATDAGRLTGEFTAHARLMTKKEAKALNERLIDEFSRGDIEDLDVALVKGFYERFEGIGNEDGALDDDAAMQAVLEGPYSGHLTSAAVQAFYAQYGEARQGNWKRPRAR